MERYILNVVVVIYIKLGNYDKIIVKRNVLSLKKCLFIPKKWFIDVFPITDDCCEEKKDRGFLQI